MRNARLALAAVAAAVAVSGCGYIVTPEDALPSASAGSVPDKGWTALVTKVAPAADSLRIELTLRNDTGDWSEMHAADGKPATLSSAGKSTSCANVFVGTGGWSLAPGFQIRGYTAGTKAKPVSQVISVECQGATAAAGGTLSIDYSYVVGDLNYYLPTPAISSKLEVKLDNVAADLKYPLAGQLPAGVAKLGEKIEAINHCDVTLTDAKRTDAAVEMTWQSLNPTEYPVYVHLCTALVGADGILYGLYESPHLSDAPITPSGNQTADMTTKVAVPAEATGLYVMLALESKQQKTFVGHVVDITDK